MEIHLELKAIAWLSGDERPWRGTRCVASPALTWFDARSHVGGPQTNVDFVGRPTAELCMRAMLVVPNEERSELPAKTGLALRNHDPSSCFVFDSANQSFDLSVLFISYSL